MDVRYEKELHLGGLMDEKFLVGIVMGMLGGGLLVANSNKVRQKIKDGQEEAVKKINEMTEKKSKNSK